jgi:hypothetical protein
MMTAIHDGRRPIRHLYITYNEFEAIGNAFYLGNSNGGNDLLRFEVSDSVIAHNIFLPNQIDPQLTAGARRTSSICSTTTRCC